MLAGLSSLTCIAGLSCRVTIPSLEATDPNMTDQERAHVVKLLEDSHKKYLCSLEDVNETQWNWEPAPGGWSVSQTAEHILLAEIVMFSAVERAIASPQNLDWEESTAGKTELLEQVMPDRSQKALAPTPVEPRQAMAKAEVIRRFNKLREKTIRFAKETCVPLKEHTCEHPFPIFNTLNAYQWLLYIPLHNLRHDQQIAEIKATPGYP